MLPNVAVSWIYEREREKVKTNIVKNKNEKEKYHCKQEK